MKIIFGLGNPGRKYVSTRHNIGYRLIDVIARKTRTRLKKNTSCCSFYGQGKFKNSQFILAKPLVFMNENGKALRLLVRKFILKDLLIVYDDIDLPLGSIRFRAKGGPGTHKGMKSCIELLGSSDFPRLRIGIRGDRGERDLSEYVLEDFTREEEKVVEEVLDQAVDKILTGFLNCSKV